MLPTRRIESPADWSAFRQLVLNEKRTFVSQCKQVLKLDQRGDLFRFDQQPFYRHGLLAAFGYWEGGSLVATVAAISDVHLIRDRREKVGYLGFFANKPKATSEMTDAVLDAALSWLRSEGLKAALAPVDLDFVRSTRWRTSGGESPVWQDSLQNRSFHPVDHGLIFDITLDELSWPAPFEGRAEVAQQSTRIQLRNRARSSALQRQFRSLWSPGSVRLQMEADLELRDWISRSDINLINPSDPLPWNKLPGEAEWLAWRNESSVNAFELEGDVLGRRAIWVRGAWLSRSKKRIRIEQVEMDPAFREFDLLPWVVISVARWCLEQGGASLEWSSLSDQSPFSKVLVEGLGASRMKPTSLWGAAL